MMHTWSFIACSEKQWGSLVCSLHAGLDPEWLLQCAGPGGKYEPGPPTKASYAPATKSPIACKFGPKSASWARM